MLFLIDKFAARVFEEGLHLIGVFGKNCLMPEDGQ